MNKALNTTKRLTVNIERMSPHELWSLYSILVRKLREIGQIRSNNVTGERGEQLAISYYNNTPGLPKLQAAPKGTQNVDAISRKGDRYTIKTLMLTVRPFLRRFNRKSLQPPIDLCRKA